VFNYIVDARKGKKSASQFENIHQLRLLYNRCLQWQFVYARSEDTLTFQKSSIEVCYIGFAPVCSLIALLKFVPDEAIVS
jgi:hypothetical protein